MLHTITQERVQERAFWNWVERSRPLGDSWRDWFSAEARVSTQTVRELAYKYWKQRGSPIGSPLMDWSRAEMALSDVEIDVQAGTPWHDTGYAAVSGVNTVSIEVLRGSWTANPSWHRTVSGAGNPDYRAKDNYALPGAFEGALVGKWGNSSPFLVGNSCSVQPGGGHLFLACNDDLPYNGGPQGRWGAGYTDNSGALHIRLNGVVPDVNTQPELTLGTAFSKIVNWNPPIWECTREIFTIDSRLQPYQRQIIISLYGAARGARIDNIDTGGWDILSAGTLYLDAGRYALTIGLVEFLGAPPPGSTYVEVIYNKLR